MDWTPDNRKRYLEGKLTEREKADILVEGPFCEYAHWAPHPRHGLPRIHCGILGRGAKHGTEPERTACRSCRYGPRGETLQRELVVSRLTRNYAFRLGPDIGRARKALRDLVHHFRIDESAQTAKDILAEALTLAPAYTGLPVVDAETIAKERGYVDEHRRVST